MIRGTLNAPDAAERIALQALAFLARDPDRIGRFLAITGIGPESLREAAREPHFMVAVLDHLLSDEPLLLVFSEEAGLRPQDIWNARRVLAGPSGNGP
jgi:hypothetical protein